MALRGGLSSRAVGGESGPIQAGGLAVGTVRRALELDAKLVPLWRAMARFADAQVELEAAALRRNPFGGAAAGAGVGAGVGAEAAGAAEMAELRRELEELRKALDALA